MRTLVYAALVLCLSTSPGHAARPSGFSVAQQAVINANKARMRAAAMRDTDTWARYVAADCIFSDDNANLQSKARMLEHYKKLPAAYDRALDPRDYVVHLYGDTAVINYRATVHEQFRDKDIVSEQRRTESFHKVNGAWLLIAVQWDNLPLNLRKALAVDPKTLAGYTGKYQWRTNDDIETILEEQGKLISSVGKDRSEYLYAGADVFFLKDDLGTYSFTRNPDGQVNGYIYQRADGQTIRASRID